MAADTQFAYFCLNEKKKDPWSSWEIRNLRTAREHWCIAVVCEPRVRDS